VSAWSPSSRVPPLGLRRGTGTSWACRFGHAVHRAGCRWLPPAPLAFPAAGLVYPLLTGLIPPSAFRDWPLLQASSAFRGPREVAHEDTWAVILQSSRYWFNYRHAANTLLLYRELRERGVPDSNIILMLSSDHACDGRNPEPCTVYDDFLSSRSRNNLFGDVEIDFFGPEVDPEAFVNVLLGRGDPRWPSGKFLGSGPSSNVVLYMTGHSHADIMKFQDKDVVTSNDLAGVVAEMERLGRYREMLVVTDTCQASTLSRLISSSAVSDLHSSIRGENSYSINHDQTLGQSMADQLTYVMTQILRSPGVDESEETLADVMRRVKGKEGRRIMSTARLRLSGSSTPASQRPVQEVLGWPGADAAFTAA